MIADINRSNKIFIILAAISEIFKYLIVLLRHQVAITSEEITSFFSLRVLKRCHLHELSLMKSMLKEIIDEKRIEVGPFLHDLLFWRWTTNSPYIFIKILSCLYPFHSHAIWIYLRPHNSPLAIKHKASVYDLQAYSFAIVWERAVQR